MGNYEQLKSAIAAVIKTNGNNEITGALLQQVLIGMTSQIGANMTFRGIATPATQPATPDQNCFYMATESGVYSNFDGQELDGTKLAIFFNSSGAWRSWLMPIVDFTFDNTPTEDSTNPVTSDGIFKALMQHDDIIFFADVNGTKYEVEYVWNPRVQDWDELMSDTPLEINAGKIYIDHISFDMFTSPYVGAWIQLNALQTATYSGTIMTEQTAIAPTGTISKLANNVTKTYDLPAESGTLARKEETLPNKTYAPLEFSGLGRKYLQKNIVSDKNVLTQAMVSESNTEFVVQYDYDLNDPNGENPIIIPANCALKFEGGSIKNGKIVFRNTSLESCKECFGDDLVIEGKVLQEASPEWFTGSDADKIERAINAFSVVKLAARNYYIDRQIVLNRSFKLSGSAFADRYGLVGVNGNWDLSSTRLITTTAFNATATAEFTPSIFKVEMNNHSVSIEIDGVSFRGLDKVGYALEICTQGGPSMPVIIHNCKASHFDHVIDINKGSYTGTESTNAFIMAVNGCTMTGNNWCICANSLSSLMNADIKNNVLEANTYGAFYSVGEADSQTGVRLSNARSWINFENNSLETSTNPITIEGSDKTTIRIVGNYFEYVSIGETIKIAGRDIDRRVNVIAEGNRVTWGGVKLNCEYANLHCSCNTDEDFTLELKDVYYEGDTPTKLSKAVNVFFKENPANSSDYMELTHYYPVKNGVQDGNYVKMLPSNSWETEELLGEQEFDAGTYRFITKLANPNSTRFEVAFGDFAETSDYLIKSRLCYFVTDLKLESASTTTLGMKWWTSSVNPAYIGDCVIAKLPSNNAYLVPQLPLDAINVECGNITTGKYIGLQIYDTSLEKTIVWNGVAWVNVDGSDVNEQDNVIDDKVLRFTDADGYIVVKIDKNGVHSVKDKDAVACMVLSESYYPTAAPTRDGSGNITNASVMFETGVSGTLDITYTNGYSTEIEVAYGNNNYDITITRDANNRVETVSVVEVVQS